MRTIVAGWIIVSAAAVGVAKAQATAPAAVAAPQATSEITTSSDVDAILDALDARGKDMSDFTADVKLTTTDNANGNDSSTSGKMWMKRLSTDDAELRVMFDRKSHNDKAEKIHQEYLLAGGMLVDRDYDRTKEVRRQVLKPGQKMNLLKLGEGPFPLPLGQDKAEVHKMFEVAKIAPAKDDPAGTVHVQLKPKPGTHFEAKFATIDFWVDPKIAHADSDRNGGFHRRDDATDRFDECAGEYEAGRQEFRARTHRQGQMGDHAGIV